MKNVLKILILTINICLVNTALSEVMERSDITVTSNKSTNEPLTQEAKAADSKFKIVKEQFSQLGGWNKQKIAKENQEIRKQSCKTPDVYYKLRKSICKKFVCPLGRLWNYSPTSLTQEASVKCACICKAKGHPHAYDALRKSLDVGRSNWNILEE